MKKIFLVFAVAAIALALAVPASAALKLTTKGEMTVDGYVVNQNLVTLKGTEVGDASNAFYCMKMLIQPTLHINDKVRIHSRITILERVWTGNVQAAGNGSFDNDGGDYRGNNEFWVEQLYVSFPLFGGTMYVGRMSGGSWAYPFQNTEDNRDRIKYVRKFGHVVLVGLIEKLVEGDGSAVLTAAPVANTNWDYSTSDINSYAVGAIIPFSKNIIYKPLFYFVDYQNVAPDTGWDLLMMNGFGLKAGGFFLDLEINFRMRERDNQFGGADGVTKDWDEVQWSGWGEAGFKSGPVEVALGGWYLEGTDSANAWESNSFWGLGGEWQPTMLLFSEDLGVLWNTMGVANASSGLSGYQAAYLRGAFKINDAMTLSGILAYVEADEMMRGSKWDGVGTADDEIGTELNITFSWNFLPNLTYSVTGAYLWTGDYFDDSIAVGTAGQRDQANNVFGMHHGITVQW